jgi:flagellar protein FlaI
MTVEPTETEIEALATATGGPPDRRTETAGEVLDDVERYFEEEASERAFGPVPDRSFIESNFFDLGPLESAEVLDGYWVDEPFVYTAILFDEDQEKAWYRYFEPELTEFEQHVREDLRQTIRHVMRNQGPAEDNARFEQTLEELVADHAATVDSASLHKIFYYLRRDFIGYDVLAPLMGDPYLEDISCDGPSVPVFVYHREYEDLATNLVFEPSQLDLFVHRLSQRIGKQVSAAEPQASGNLPDGSRIQITLDSDVATRGSNFTIRTFDETPFTPVDLINLGTFSLDEMAFIWLAVEHNMSLMFVGPTASGKTTSMNAVSLFLQPQSKVVSIEQVRELSIPHSNWVSYITREVKQREDREEITMYDLLQSALHQRPQYILVGEIRTDPTVVRTFFQSIFTGHPGATTFHASSAEDAISRLTSEPLDITGEMASALDIVAVQHQVMQEDGRSRPRRSLSLSEVTGEDEGTSVGRQLDAHVENVRSDVGDDDSVSLTTLFEWDAESDRIEQTVDSLAGSEVLQQVGAKRGWETKRVLDALDRRREVLSYMVEQDITDYDDVAATLFLFDRNEERVLDEMRAGTYEPSPLSEILDQ